MPPKPKASFNPVTRIRFWYTLLLFAVVICIGRLFYLQIIRHGYYQTVARRGQLKQYEIPATRGVISAYSGGQVTPLVLNETLYTVYADPTYIKKAGEYADALHKAIGGSSDEYEKQLKAPNTRYVVLAKRIGRSQREAVDKLDLIGVFTREDQYRTYPQGGLAAQVLGFVNDEGNGKYGLEQSLDGSLKGKPGQLKAITDARGVPLAANKDNISIAPKAGDNVLLSIDIGMQQQLEDILKSGLESVKSPYGGAVIIDPKTGAVKAMANWPTYNPADFSKVQDASVFTNGIASAPLEVGSIMKPLTLAAALDLGVVNKNTSYYDPSYWKIDGATITNVEEDGGAGNHNMADILQLSLNTGATWLVQQMGGGEINSRARRAWHNYMSDHYRLGKPTGIEQGFEAAGVLPDPDKGYGLNLQFANSAFGQGMTATPLQMALALGSVVNGGTYYQPHLVEATTDASGKKTILPPTVMRQNVVKPAVSQTMIELMTYVFSRNHAVYGMPNLRPEYMIGGKTGTAQLPKPTGGYYEDRFNGTFMGFVGGNMPQYVIVVRTDTPTVPGYAGSKAAGPIFVRLANMLIDNFGVTPRS
jgi:cell division protein FtsI/penicillin-binding protein 2